MEILAKIGGILYLLLAGMALAGRPMDKWFIVLTFIIMALYTFKAGKEV